MRAFSLEQREVERFEKSTTALVVAQMKTVKYSKALTPAIEVLSGLAWPPPSTSHTSTG
ncbi:MAG: hypothetical protein WDM96_12925 [Lacunisphaera sp.]